ncbi:UDP-N-acetylglucosamine transferase subunit ALG14 [Prorops nasuta]|uniref:UDP-N-acetylglucosamine transferase subunit ALG14 n=1 Tax=Prorops nasuta TaxID=863751 RepID=UPI0034CF2FD6
MYLVILYLYVFLGISIIILSIRVRYLMSNKNRMIEKKTQLSAVKTMIVLGSGGHTAEMLRIVEHLNSKNYSPRLYVIAFTDKISVEKVKKLEDTNTDYSIKKIYRSREVHQTYLTSIWTTLIAIIDATFLFWKERPELLLCNGPGTCVPLCIVAFISKVFYLSSTTIIFIESFCRVKTLSLSGKILYYLVDYIIVQWPNLSTPMYKRTIFI